MAKVICPRCDSKMKLQKDAPMYSHDLYECPKCGRHRMLKHEAYHSPSQQRMDAIKNKRLADRWGKKIGGK